VDAANSTLLLIDGRLMITLSKLAYTSLVKLPGKSCSGHYVVGEIFLWHMSVEAGFWIPNPVRRLWFSLDARHCTGTKARKALLALTASTPRRLICAYPGIFPSLDTPRAMEQDVALC
jgi:hypothetical protein